MAWTAPSTWTSGQIIMASGSDSLNEQVRDNFLALSGHAHSGAAGDGSATLTGVSFSNTAGYQFADQSADPSVNGTIQRNNTNILYYDGTSAIDLTAADQAAGTASLRSLGVSGTVAAAGDHQHATSVAITDLERSNTTGINIVSAYPSSGLPTGQTGYTATPTGVEYTMFSYAWTPTTADNCYLSVSTSVFNNNTYIYNLGTTLLTLAVGSMTVTLRLKVDGSTVDTIAGVTTLNTGSATFDLYKTTNTTAKTITATAEVTLGTSPTGVTDTDGSGNPTTTNYWSNCLTYLKSGREIKQLVFTV